MEVFYMPAAKKKQSASAKKKQSAAERARERFDSDPTTPADVVVPPPSERVVVEQPRPPPPRLLSKSQVLALVPVSYPCLWAMMKRGEFPRSRRLGAGSNRIAWVESEVLAW